MAARSKSTARARSLIAKGAEDRPDGSRWRHVLLAITIFVSSAAMLVASNYLIVFLLDLKPVWFVMAVVLVVSWFWAWYGRRVLLDRARRRVVAVVYAVATTPILNASATAFNNASLSLQGFMPASAGEWRQLTLMFVALAASTWAGTRLGTALHPHASRLNEQSWLAKAATRLMHGSGRRGNELQGTVVGALVEAVVGWLLGLVSLLASLGG